MTLRAVASAADLLRQKNSQLLASTTPSSRYWDIGVPEGDQDVGGKYYPFVIDDPQLGTDPEVVVRWDTGNVGINKVSPGSKLDVVSGASGNAIQGSCMNAGALATLKDIVARLLHRCD